MRHCFYWTALYMMLILSAVILLSLWLVREFLRPLGYVIMGSLALTFISLAVVSLVAVVKALSWRRIYHVGQYGAYMEGRSVGVTPLAPLGMPEQRGGRTVVTQLPVKVSNGQPRLFGDASELDTVSGVIDAPNHILAHITEKLAPTGAPAPGSLVEDLPDTVPGVSPGSDIGKALEQWNAGNRSERTLAKAMKSNRYEARKLLAVMKKEGLI